MKYLGVDRARRRLASAILANAMKDAGEKQIKQSKRYAGVKAFAGSTCGEIIDLALGIPPSEQYRALRHTVKTHGRVGGNSDDG